MGLGLGLGLDLRVGGGIEHLTVLITASEMHVTLNACGMGWTSEGTSAAVQSTSMRRKKTMKSMGITVISRLNEHECIHEYQYEGEPFGLVDAEYIKPSDRSQPFFCFVPQEKILTAKQAQL